MRNRVLVLSCGVSTVLLVALLSIYTYGLIIEPKVAPTLFHFRLGPNVNVELDTKQGANLLLFNRGVPYMGSFVGVVGDKRTSVTCWDGCGIYFRLIRDKVGMGGTWWTLMISLWYPILLLGVLPLVLVVKTLRAGKPVPSPEGGR